MANFVVKFPIFRYHGNGWPEKSLTDTIKVADPQKPLVVASLWAYLLHKPSCKFSLPWQQGSVRAKCDWHSWIGRPRKPYIEPKIATVFYMQPNLWHILW